MASFKPPGLPWKLVGMTFSWTVPCPPSSLDALHLTLESNCLASESWFPALRPSPPCVLHNNTVRGSLRLVFYYHFSFEWRKQEETFPFQDSSAFAMHEHKHGLEVLIQGPMLIVALLTRFLWFPRCHLGFQVLANSRDSGKAQIRGQRQLLV